MISMNTQALVESYLDWWGAAGLTAPARDERISWFAAPIAATRAVDRVTPHPIPQQQSVVTAPPKEHGADALNFADIAAFDAWIAQPGNAPFAHWSQRLALPYGPANPDIMLVSDYPEDDDCRAGRLFSGEQGALLQAMLKAIDLDLAGQRCAAISCSRPPSQRFDSASISVLQPVVEQQITLVKPRVLLLLGARSSAVLTGRAVVPAPDDQPDINHQAGTVKTFMTYHPRELLARPQLKRHAWEVLKRMRKYL